MISGLILDIIALQFRAAMALPDGAEFKLKRFSRQRRRVPADPREFA